MENSQTINVPGIGAVLFERTVRTHRILITVRPGKGVRVAVPRRASFRNALDFLNSKKAWVQKHLAKVRDYDKQKQAFNEAFLAIDREKATQQITARLARLAEKHGFKYGKVYVKNQRTRWGSCSANSNISLNMKLVALPPEMQDYVILHELVHTRVHNHSPRFWKELNKYVGDGKALGRKTVEYGLRLL